MSVGFQIGVEITSAKECVGLSPTTRKIKRYFK